MLTHSNIVAELAGIEGAYNVPSDISHLSYLPLAHIFERVIMLTAVHKGGQVGFFHGVIYSIPLPFF
jgi:long-chain acyl-CoA synthetase